jgi:arginyl-tRNA--protein-N-Asp/Glu arginylyltransferase
MKPQLGQLPLYLSAPHPCSYLTDRQSNTLFADPEGPMDMATYSELLTYGFRRSGRMVYAPRCDFCSQCVSVRIPVEDFRPRRIHRRVARSNAVVERIIRPAQFRAEHFALYQRYTRHRHSDGEMAQASEQEYMAFLTSSWSDTRFVEFRLADRLLGVAVTDFSTDGLSAFYTFFDPDFDKRSPGTLAILQQVGMAREMALDYLYLGYWVADSPKMAYKIDFRPIELWRQGRWRRLQAGESPGDY